MKPKIAITLVVATALTGCQQGGNSASGAPAMTSADAGQNEAIHTAIQAHLAHNGNLNLKSFDAEVKQVRFDGNRAQAQVEFHTKNGPGTMQLTYALAKRDGAWSVVESTSGGSNFSHPALDKAQVPAVGGTTGGDSSVFQVMDHLRSRTATRSQNLPPGHPRVAASPKDASPQAP